MKNKIEFWTDHEGLSLIPEVVPRRQSRIKPEWWKNVPSGSENIKSCPSFFDMFSTHFVIPMWCDTKITIESDGVSWETSNNEYWWTFHRDDQFKDHSTTWVKKNINAILKPISPWYIKTPKGYSVYQMPVFYDFNEDFSVLPGIIDTDRYHQINPQVLIHSEKKTFMIKRGDPLISVFPFKKENFNIDVREQTKEDRLNLAKVSQMINTKFNGGYRKDCLFRSKE